MSNATRENIRQNCTKLVRGLLPLFNGREFVFPRSELRGYPWPGHPMRSERDEWFESQVRPLLAIVPYLADQRLEGQHDRYVTSVATTVFSNVLNRVFVPGDESHVTPNLEGQVLMEFAHLVMCERMLSSMGLSLVNPRMQTHYGIALMEASQAKVNHSTNWLWIKIFLNLARLQMGDGKNSGVLGSLFDDLEKLYVSDGWYADQLDGKPVFDYYGGWAFYWWPFICMGLNAGDLVSTRHLLKIIGRFPKFARSYAALFNNGAHEKWGRSGIYRHAACAPFVAAGFVNSPVLTQAWHRDLVRANILHSVLDEEYWEANEDARYPSLKGHIVDPYSCDASPLWCAISYWCLCLPDSHFFWSLDTDHTSAPVQAKTDFGLSVERTWVSRHEAVKRTVIFDQHVVYPDKEEPDPRYKLYTVN